jgi:hypothetical protein
MTTRPRRWLPLRLLIEIGDRDRLRYRLDGTPIPERLWLDGWNLAEEPRDGGLGISRWLKPANGVKWL